MLHLAMGCFDGVTLSDTETTIRHPWLAQRLHLSLRMGLRHPPRYYVTKRDFGWFREHRVAQMLAQMEIEKIGLIHLVRDPRDVMLSRYVGSKRDAIGKPYVSENHWFDSISAAERIFAAVGGRSKKLVLRYEDVISNTEATQGKLAEVFGLKLRPNAFSMDRVKDNFERLRIRFNRTTLRNLGELRNMDSKSIGKWRESDAVPIAASLSPRVYARFERFCAEYGYQ
jgi:hypothetical protein